MALKVKKELFAMSLSRRRFVKTATAGAAGLWIAGRGREAGLFDPGFQAELEAQTNAPMILASNENPGGPGSDVLDAVRAAFGEIGRYPRAGDALYDPARPLPLVPTAEVTEMIAKKHGIKAENVLLGSGSTQILRSTTHVFCSKTAPLVAPSPAYEECAAYAGLMGYPVRTVKLAPPPELKMDIAALLDNAKGGGMVFFCNPNNPVGTAVDGKTTREFIAALGRSSPGTTTLVDEAYFEYATMPGYETMIPLAVENPRVVVARTFSKAYGMAGLRIGYAVGHRDSIRKLRDWDDESAVNVLGLAAARAALAQSAEVIANERKRNADARAFTARWFEDRGYTPTDSQANFVFVDIKRPARAFRDACAKRGVLVARDFPPYEKTHCRISISTMEDMQRAVKVFEQALN
jgi:histidinol-phosphate aminotransferase